MRENILINDRFAYHNTKTRKDILARQRKNKELPQPRNRPVSPSIQYLEETTATNYHERTRENGREQTGTKGDEPTGHDTSRQTWLVGDLVQKALISIIPPSWCVALIIFLSHLCLSLCLSSDEPVCDAKETISFASLVQFFSCFTWDWLM